MKTRRIVAALVAATLAVVGVALVALYVQGADQRAAAGLEPTEVLVVTQEIPVGSTAALGTNVTTQQIPLQAVVEGALTDLDSLQGQVATSVIYPGEQLLAARFAAPETLTDDSVVVPPEMVQVTVQLSPERVIGGRLRAGDTVGFVMSSTEPEPYSETILHGVLVSRVQAAAPEQDQGQDAPPTDTHFITFAVGAHDAERIVWAAEHALIWLTLEREESDVSGTTRVTMDNVGATPLGESETEDPDTGDLDATEDTDS